MMSKYKLKRPEEMLLFLLVYLVFAILTAGCAH